METTVSDERNEPPTEDRAAAAVSTANPTKEGSIETSAPPRPVRVKAALWLAALLILAIGGVALSPFWAPNIAPLLPWGQRPPKEKYDPLAARIAALEQRPTPPAIDADALKSAQAALAQRAAALETAVNTLRQNQEDSATAKTAVAQLNRRLDKIEAQSASSAAAQTSEIQKAQQQLAQQGAAAGGLAERLAALEHQVQTQGNADRTGSALMLALLQMREAVEEARPFAREYAAFKDLAARDPDLSRASEPLADAARDGVASRAQLRQGLTDLAQQIATAPAPTAKAKWWEQALDRLRGLVTIRRVGGAVKSGPEAVVEAAQSALAKDDLAGAVAVLGKLTGANEAAAQPWLRMARQRLAAEAALTHLQELAAARLAAAPAASPAAPAPAPASGEAPAHPPAIPKTPS